MPQKLAEAARREMTKAVACAKLCKTRYELATNEYIRDRYRALFSKARLRWDAAHQEHRTAQEWLRRVYRDA